jgi:hypothetical protein
VRKGTPFYSFKKASDIRIFFSLSPLWGNPYSKLLGSGYTLVNVPVSTGDSTDPNCVEATIPSKLPGTFVRDFKSFFGPQTANSLCLLEEGSFEKTLKSKGSPLDQSQAFKTSVQNSDVLIAGEMHLYTDLKHVWHLRCHMSLSDIIIS